MNSRAKGKAGDEGLPLQFLVYGRPAPQGSKRFVGVRGGRGVLVESSKAVKPWRELVHAAAVELRGHLPGAVGRLPEPLDGPLVLRMVFTLPKPAGAPKRRRTYPDRMPDLSKLARSTEDALVSAGLIADDARIVEYERLAKVYPNEDAEALSSPGVRIELARLVRESDMGDMEGPK